MLTLCCIFICIFICYVHQNNSSFISNGKHILLQGRELHIKIILGASLSPVGKEVTWGCQCAAASGSVCAGALGSACHDKYQVCVPWLRGEGPADQGNASVVFISTEQGVMASPASASGRFTEHLSFGAQSASFPGWCWKGLWQRIIQSLCWLQPQRGWGVMHSGLVA